MIDKNGLKERESGEVDRQNKRQRKIEQRREEEV